MKPPKNGITPHRTHNRRVNKAVAYTGKPIGRPPKNFDALEKESWKAVIAECPWVNLSHRQGIIVLALAVARVERITLFFRERQAQFAKEGISVANAYLNDENGKQHPLMTVLIASERNIRAGLADMGATPASQAKMMSDIGLGKSEIEHDQLTADYLR